MDAGPIACPTCRLLNHADAPQCDCGYRFATGLAPPEVAPPPSVLVLRTILIVLMASFVASVGTAILLVTLPPAAAEPLAGIAPLVLSIPPHQIDANVASTLVGRSVWPLLGCGLAIAALKKRRSTQWQVAIALLVMSSFSPLSWLNSFLVTLPLAIAASSAKGLKGHLASRH